MGSTVRISQQTVSIRKSLGRGSVEVTYERLSKCVAGGSCWALPCFSPVAREKRETRQIPRAQPRHREKKEAETRRQRDGRRADHRRQGGIEHVRPRSCRAKSRRRGQATSSSKTIRISCLSRTRRRRPAGRQRGPRDRRPDRGGLLRNQSLGHGLRKGRLVRRRQGPRGGLRAQVPGARRRKDDGQVQPAHLETGLHRRNQGQRPVQDPQVDEGTGEARFVLQVPARPEAAEHRRQVSRSHRRTAEGQDLSPTRYERRHA